MLLQNVFLLTVMMATVNCGGKEEEKHEDKPQRIHTIHHHHIKKYTVIKKIEVPVIKEVKVPFKVYYVEKVPYKYYVKPLIVKVPVEYYHTKEEKHEEPEHHEEHHHEEEHEQEQEHGHEHHHESSGYHEHNHHY